MKLLEQIIYFKMKRLQKCFVCRYDLSTKVPYHRRRKCFTIDSLENKKRERVLQMTKEHISFSDDLEIGEKLVCELCVQSIRERADSEKGVVDDEKGAGPFQEFEVFEEEIEKDQILQKNCSTSGAGRPSRVFSASDFFKEDKNGDPEICNIKKSVGNRLTKSAHVIKGIFDNFENDVPLTISVSCSMVDEPLAKISFPSLTSDGFSVSITFKDSYETRSPQSILIEKQETHQSMFSIKEMLKNRGLKKKWKDVEAIRKNSQSNLEKSVYVGTKFSTEQVMLIKDPIAIVEEIKDDEFVVMIEDIFEFYLKQRERRAWCNFEEVCTIDLDDELGKVKIEIPIFEFSDESKILRGEQLTFSTAFLRVCCTKNPLSKFGLLPFRIQKKGFKFWENLEVFGNGFRSMVERFENYMLSRSFTNSSLFYKRLFDVIESVFPDRLDSNQNISFVLSFNWKCLFDLCEQRSMSLCGVGPQTNRTNAERYYGYFSENPADGDADVCNPSFIYTFSDIFNDIVNGKSSQELFASKSFLNSISGKKGSDFLMDNLHCFHSEESQDRRFFLSDFCCTMFYLTSKVTEDGSQFLRDYERFINLLVKEKMLKKMCFEVCKGVIVWKENEMCYFNQKKNRNFFSKLSSSTHETYKVLMKRFSGKDQKKGSEDVLKQVKKCLSDILDHFSNVSLLLTIIYENKYFTTKKQFERLFSLCDQTLAARLYIMGNTKVCPHYLSLKSFVFVRQCLQYGNPTFFNMEGMENSHNDTKYSFSHTYGYSSKRWEKREFINIRTGKAEVASDEMKSFFSMFFFYLHITLNNKVPSEIVGNNQITKELKPSNSFVLFNDFFLKEIDKERLLEILDGFKNNGFLLSVQEVNEFKTFFEDTIFSSYASQNETTIRRNDYCYDDDSSNDGFESVENKIVLRAIENEESILSKVPSIIRNDNNSNFISFCSILSEWKKNMSFLKGISGSFCCFDNFLKLDSFDISHIVDLLKRDEIKLVLNHEQINCLEKMFRMYFEKRETSCLVCADMGWGKTRTKAMYFLIHMTNGTLSQVIIASRTRILMQWFEEIEAILLKLEIFPWFNTCHFYAIVENKKKEKKETYVKSLVQKGGLCLCTFESFKNFYVFDEFTNENLSKCLLVVDESHYLKSKNSQFMKSMLSFSAKLSHVLFSTGTLYNEEDTKFSSQMSIFFHQKDFIFNTTNLEEVKKIISPHFLRMKVDLSPLKLNVFFLKVDLPTELQKFYNEFLNFKKIKCSVDSKTIFPSVGVVAEVVDFSLNSLDLCFKKMNKVDSSKFSIFSRLYEYEVKHS